jgi:hypothetical protein
MNLQETAQNIFNSYFTEQTPEEVLVQEQRKKVCYGDENNPPCEKLRKIELPFPFTKKENEEKKVLYVCGECGCPTEKLTRKISTSNICHLNKWEK